MEQKNLIMNLRVGRRQIKAFFNFCNAFSITLDAVEEGLNVRMKTNHFIAEERQHPTRLESTSP